MKRRKLCRRCGIRHEPCSECGKIVHDGDWPYCPHHSTTQESGQRFNPVVIHVDDRGNYRFPGRADAKVPKHFQRVELKTLRDMEQFERKVNARLREESDQHNIKQDLRFAEIQEKNRRDLRTAMERMSPAGRAFADFAIRHNNDRRRKTSECGFHLHILHYDSSNREPHRDDRTGWKTRKD